MIHEAFDVAEFLALSSDEQFSYLQDLGERIGFEIGFEIGFNKGQLIEKIKIAKLSLSQGLDVETVPSITGLTI